MKAYRWLPYPNPLRATTPQESSRYLIFSREKS